EDVRAGFATEHWAMFGSMLKPENIVTVLLITIGITTVILINFYLRHAYGGLIYHRWFERFAPYGPLIVRVALAISLFESAISGSFLGPELHFPMVVGATALRFGLLVASFLILL